MNYTTTIIKVTYADVDLMQVVHNTKYIEYFERGRLDFLSQFVMPYKELIEIEEIQIPVTLNSAKYFNPAFYDDNLELITKVESYSRRRLQFNYQLYREGILISEGISKHTFIKNGILKPFEIPELFITRLSQINEVECQTS
jgi:acyl-CoA thioester hydrolase